MSRHRKTPGELELLPVMNLVTILIPMLLLGAELAHLGMVETEAPQIGDHSDPVLSLTVAITGGGFSVQGADAVLRPDSDAAVGAPGVSVPCAASCRTSQGYDYAELSRLLSVVKDEYPDEDSLVLTSEPAVAYEVLIHTMDAARSLDGRPLFPHVSIAGGVPPGDAVAGG